MFAFLTLLECLKGAGYDVHKLGAHHFLIFCVGHSITFFTLERICHLIFSSVRLLDVYTKTPPKRQKKLQWTIRMHIRYLTYHFLSVVWRICLMASQKCVWVSYVLSRIELMYHFLSAVSNLWLDYKEVMWRQEWSKVKLQVLSKNILCMSSYCTYV